MVKKQPEFTAFLPVLLSVSALCSHPLLFLIGKVFFLQEKKKKVFVVVFSYRKPWCSSKMHFSMGCHSCLLCLAVSRGTCGFMRG